MVETATAPEPGNEPLSSRQNQIHAAHSSLASDLNLQETLSLGTDTGAGNLIGIQPYMLPRDYSTRRTFYAKLAGYLEIAREAGWLNPKSIVVFPEYIGAWLVVAGEKDAVSQAETITAALRTLILSNLLSFVRIVLTIKVQPRPADVIKHSLFRLKAAQMAGIYQAVFSRLAREYGVTIVAGSTLLPSPRLLDGALVAGDGALMNISMVLKPDGSSHEELVRKAFPTGDELPFIAAASTIDLPVFQTPAGRLAVLICADSWHPASYAGVLKKAPELLAVPSYLTPDAVWQKAWKGYDPGPPPGDVDPADVGHLTEGEAWQKYALPGRMGLARVRHGINVFLRGRIWDLGSDGRTLIMRGSELSMGRLADGATITNCWLD